VISVRENVVKQLKHVKCHVFELKTYKREKRTRSFTGPSFFTLRSVLNYTESLPVSQQHQTCCLEMNFEANISIDIHNGSEWITFRELEIELQ